MEIEIFKRTHRLKMLVRHLQEGRYFCSDSVGVSITDSKSYGYNLIRKIIGVKKLPRLIENAWTMVHADACLRGGYFTASKETRFGKRSEGVF